MFQDEIYECIEKDTPWCKQPYLEVLGSLKNGMAFFRSAADPGPVSDTSCVAIVGPHSCFEDDGPNSFEKISDGADQTICAIEFLDSNIHWLQPKDATIDEAVDIVANSKKETVFVLFANGDVRYVHRTADPDIIRSAMTIDGGESIDWTIFKKLKD